MQTDNLGNLIDGISAEIIKQLDEEYHSLQHMSSTSNAEYIRERINKHKPQQLLHIDIGGLSAEFIAWRIINHINISESSSYSNLYTNGR